MLSLQGTSKRAAVLTGFQSAKVRLDFSATATATKRATITPPAVNAGMSLLGKKSDESQHARLGFSLLVWRLLHARLRHRSYWYQLLNLARGQAF